MKRRLAYVVITLMCASLLGGIFAGCGGNDNGGGYSPGNAEFLFIQTAQSGTYEDGDLVLVGVAPYTTQFSNRPYREAGHIPTDEFVSYWDDGGMFDKDPPNAALSVSTGSQPVEYIVELVDVEPTADGLRYQVNVLSDSATIPPAFNSVALFIDDASPGSHELNPLFGGTRFMGVCYSPYHQAGKGWGDYTKDDIDADMEKISQHFTFTRTYTVQYANRYNVELAHKYGVQVALGAWIFPGNSANTQKEIDTVLQQANDYPDTVKCIVIGNEVDNGNYTPEEVKQAIVYAKDKKKNYSKIINIPVTICFTGNGWINGAWSNLLAECEEYVFLTIYPWFAPSPQPDNIAPNMQWSYNNGMKQAEAKGLTVIIAETGWPSAGVASKGTTPENEKVNFQTTCTWINGNNFLNRRYVTFWFEMFDEPWKADKGPQEPHWGLYGSGQDPQPKFQIPSCN
ncbi:glycosyl hydrolase family 17 protein [Chloroflexota bacterium]